jgi:hypothetical protein
MTYRKHSKIKQDLRYLSWISDIKVQRRLPVHMDSLADSFLDVGYSRYLRYPEDGVGAS